MMSEIYESPMVLVISIEPNEKIMDHEEELNNGDTSVIGEVGNIQNEQPNKWG